MQNINFPLTTIIFMQNILMQNIFCIITKYFVIIVI